MRQPLSVVWAGMIDLRTETVMSFAQAARLLPRRRTGKKPHVATLYRWAQRGCRGVRLEFIQVGGTRCTSGEALQRFCDALSRPAASPPADGLSPSRLRHLAEVDRELDEEGI
jgi:hypothetical protein